MPDKGRCIKCKKLYLAIAAPKDKLCNKCTPKLYISPDKNDNFHINNFEPNDDWSTSTIANWINIMGAIS